MRFMDRIRQSLSRALYGRYGSDQLSRVILYVSIGLLFLAYATGIGLFMTFSFAGYIWAIFRIFSKNKEARARENMLYLQKTEKSLAPSHLREEGKENVRIKRKVLHHNANLLP